MTLLEQIKKELRISHSLLDSVLTIQIAEAEAELIRLGCSATTVGLHPALIDRAVKDYVMAQNTEGDKSEKYMAAFKYEADCLRRSGTYAED